MIKRGFDLVLATIGLVLLAPLMIAIAIAVKLDSPGPALFRQARVGRRELQFEILKFRTMRNAVGPGGLKITPTGDGRITPVGRLLRRFKLDELPQLWNVVRGDMSLVGPRPEVPEYVQYYSRADRALIFSIRPGITDEAAIEFRDEGSLLANAADPHEMYLSTILPRKLQLQREYVRAHDLTRDLNILMQTMRRSWFA